MRGPAATVIGVVPQSLDLGFCATLETVPVTTLGGTTTAAGQWSSSLVAGSLLAFPQVTLYARFAQLDGALPSGLGLSPCGATTRRCRTSSA